MTAPAITLGRALRGGLAAAALLVALSGGSPAAAEGCANPKSAAFEIEYGNPTDEAARNVVRIDAPTAHSQSVRVSFPLVTETTFTTAVARIVFTAPDSAKSSVSGTIEIETDTLQGAIGLFEKVTFGFGPLEPGGATPCARRIDMSASNPDLLTPDAAFAKNTFDVNNFGPNDGATAYVVQGLVGDGQAKVFRLRLKAKFVPGARYEAFFAGSYISGALAPIQVGARLKADFGGVDNGGDPPIVVEVDPDRVKVQPETRTSSCPLTTLQHLTVAIRVEDALKLRVEARSREIQAALDRVSDSGANPGPALRALDKLVASIEKDVRQGELDLVIGGLEFAQRHLECAKTQLELEQISEGAKTAAAEQIDLAIADDAAAITAIRTRNPDIQSAAVRLQGALDSTAQNIGFGLLHKRLAGEAVDEGFSVAPIGNESVGDVLERFQSDVAAAGDRFAELLGAQNDLMRDNDLEGAVTAILEVQQTDCIEQFFDEVVHQYTAMQTVVQARLEQIRDEAETAREQKAAEREMKTVVRTYTKAITRIVKAEEKVVSVYGGLIGDDEHRTQRKITALLKILRTAQLIGDNALKRKVEKELKKFPQFGSTF